MANTVNGVYYAQGTNYNNGQYDDATVRRAQAYVGTAQDGMWGANSAAAAGGRSLDQIVAEMNGGNTYAAGGGYSSGYASGASSSDLTAYLKQQAAEQLQSDLASLKNAYEKNLSVYDEQARNLPAQYEQARNDAAAQNAIAQRAFNERAAASGLNTGADGQADLTKSAMYQQLLAQIDREEAEALQQIEAEKSRLQAEYENAIAAATSQSNASLNSSLYNELVRLQNMRAEQDALAAKLASTNGSGTGGGSSARSGGGTNTGGGYDNQGVSADAVKQMQRALGMPESQVDGKWGAQTQAAYEDAGYTGKGAADAWNTYVRETKYLEELRR